MEFPTERQVIELPLVILVIVFVFTLDAGPEKFTDIGVTVPAPVVMLLNVFPFTDFTGPLEAEAPSVLLKPVKAEAPVRVMFEKLFEFIVWLDPFTDDALDDQTVVEPTPVRVKPVTIELLLNDNDAPLIMVGAKEKKVIVPVVFTDMLVNVLLLNVCVSGFPPWVMKVIAEVAATVCPKVLKSLLLMLQVVVAFTLELGRLIPFIATDAPGRSDKVLLLIAWVRVPVGALLDAATWIPFRVPTVTPPFELVTVLREMV